MYPRGAEGWRSKVAFGALRLQVGSTQLSLPGQWKGQMMPAGSVLEIVEIMGGQKAVLKAFQHLSQHCRSHCWGARMRAAVQVWSGAGGVRSHTFWPLETPLALVTTVVLYPGCLLEVLGECFKIPVALFLIPIPETVPSGPLWGSRQV